MIRPQLLGTRSPTCIITLFVLACCTVNVLTKLDSKRRTIMRARSMYDAVRQNLQD